MNRKMTFFMAPESDPPPAAPAAPATAKPPATPPAAPAAPAAPPAAPATVLTPPPAPEEIKLTFPDGVKFQQAHLDNFTKLAKEIGLKSDAAQKVADLYVGMRKEEATQQVEMITKWAEDAKSDKEFGGTSFDQNVQVAKKALDRVGTPALKEFLATSGLGNHPEVIRLFWKIGKTISEDRLPRDGSGDPNAEPSLEQQMQEAFPASPGMFKK